MSHLQIIQELCEICEAQSHVIREQSAALAQLGAETMEDERVALERRLAAMLGRDECPDEIGG